jgi:hypothetical protein
LIAQDERLAGATDLPFLLDTGVAAVPLEKPHENH